MANATVEQFKDIGLKYGEKIGLGVAGLVCLLFIGQAIANKPLEITPQQIEEAAKAADANLNRSEPEERIVEKLANDDKVKLHIPDLAARIAKNDQAKLADNSDAGAKFGPFHPWVTTEPGAGKIRETPPLDLLVINDIDAAANRGGPVLFARDEKGERKYAKADEEEKDDQPKARRGSRRKKSANVDTTKAEKEELQKRLNAAALTKNDESAPAETPKAETKPESDPSQPKPVEALVGKRWVAVVGTVDNKKLRDAWMKALKVDLSSAYPNYLGVELERKRLQDDGKWSDWTPVDRQKNELVQLDMTGAEKEIVPETMILPTLVDRLPFLQVGYWRGVHVAKLVPEELKKPKPEAETDTAEEEGGGNYTEANMGPDYGKMMAQTSKARSTSGYGPAGSSPAGASSGAENTSFPHSDSPTLMIRSLDFTVEPGAVYLYRARLVVANPNLNRDDVMPGTDVTTKQLKGTWSEVPYPVSIPDDISAYVAKVSPAGNEKLQFEVAAWNADDGQTIVKDFDAGPGQIIGYRASASVPNYDGKEPKIKPVDFTSKILVLDTEGGSRGISDLGLSGADFDIPARALVLNPNGALSFYSQAKDAIDPEMKNMEETYKLALKESQKKKVRKKNEMGGYGGMMGGYGGGGYGGGGGGGYGGMMGGYGGGRR